MIKSFQLLSKEKKKAVIRVFLMNIFLFLISISSNELEFKILGFILVAILSYRNIQIIKNPDLINVRIFEKNESFNEEFEIRIQAISDSITFKQYLSQFGISLRSLRGKLLVASTFCLFFYTFQEKSSLEASLLNSFLVTSLIVGSGYLGFKSSYLSLRKTIYVLKGLNSEKTSKIRFERWWHHSIRLKIGTVSMFGLIVRTNSEEIEEVFSWLSKTKEIKKLK